MLGKHHISISLVTILPFIIPLFFMYNNSISYSLAFMIAVMIGSLIPDADCGGNSTLFYRFNLIDKIMKKVVNRFVIWIFNKKYIKDALKINQPIINEHRGIMHSPMGILISTILLTIILTISLIFIQMFDLIFLILIFLGIFIGQFLHLLEDSCTIRGINWKFPFGEREIKGKIYTFSKNPEKVDIRPIIYSYSLGAFSFLLVIGFVFNKIKFSLFVLYPIIFLIVIFLWVIFLSISRQEEDIWLKDKNKIKSFKKFSRKYNKNFIGK
jgi:membrane-bound metal-dependent hydrolase YbcI (DUF457 family)